MEPLQAMNGTFNQQHQNLQTDSSLSSHGGFLTYAIDHHSKTI